MTIKFMQRAWENQATYQPINGKYYILVILWPAELVHFRCLRRVLARQGAYLHPLRIRDPGALTVSVVYTEPGPSLTLAVDSFVVNSWACKQRSLYVVLNNCYNNNCVSIICYRQLSWKGAAIRILLAFLGNNSVVRIRSQRDLVLWVWAHRSRLNIIYNDIICLAPPYWYR